MYVQNLNYEILESTLFDVYSTTVSREMFLFAYNIFDNHNTKTMEVTERNLNIEKKKSLLYTKFSKVTEGKLSNGMNRINFH